MSNGSAFSFYHSEQFNLPKKYSGKLSASLTIFNSPKFLKFPSIYGSPPIHYISTWDILPICFCLTFTSLSDGAYKHDSEVKEKGNIIYRSERVRELKACHHLEEILRNPNRRIPAGDAIAIETPEDHGLRKTWTI